MAATRMASIDLFRGLTIALMVFFTVSYWASAAMPDILKHNIGGTLHIGDFVLPMFLFASGMSLVFFHEKRKGRKDYWLDAIERFGKLAIIALVLSVFSGGGFLGMDEVMLSALLFLVSIALLNLPDGALEAGAFIPVIAYLALMRIGALPDFDAAYLGGYPAAVFYLPIMLAGAMAGKRLAHGGERADISIIAIASMAAYLVLIPIVPPFKSVASPSFMALTIAISFWVFEAARGLRNGFLEYLGRKPIRFWLIMYVLFLIPLAVYATTSGTDMPFAFVPAWGGILSGALCIPLAYLISRAMDSFSWLDI